MSGTLYVVATPIGNLEDITLRALRVLREASLIAAEDTRRTARLLTHHGITTRTISFHEHNLRMRLPQLMSRLRRGDAVALVSDAGTPGISDPGLELVQACVTEGIPVDPLPGASATLTALVASGFPTAPATFLGFPPAKGTDRTRWLADVAGVRHTVVFFEAPHRIADLLADAAPALGDRPIVVGRELTKKHQEFLRGTATLLAERLKDARGELTVVLGPVPHTEEAPAPLPEPSEIASIFRQMTESRGLTRRQAISELAKRYRRSSRDVYARLEASKQPVP